MIHTGTSKSYFFQSGDVSSRILLKTFQRSSCAVVAFVKTNEPANLCVCPQYPFADFCQGPVQPKAGLMEGIAKVF